MKPYQLNIPLLLNLKGKKRISIGDDPPVAFKETKGVSRGHTEALGGDLPQASSSLLLEPKMFKRLFVLFLYNLIKADMER